MAVLALALASLWACAVTAGGAVDPTSYNHKTERHHALTAPLDKAQVYWNFGGSAVLTKNFVRLTQDTQARNGWLWNDYPVESPNFEVEFQLEISSKPNFGGDGMCMWILSADMDPSFTDEGEGISGPILGIREDFEGMGVCFDVYDNDQRRNNPSVFVLHNPKGTKKTFNHDNDFEDDMLKSNTDIPVKLAHKCVADVRNAGKAHKVLVKFLHRTLHVYIDSQMGQGYKFCLMVAIDQTFEDHHLAFTAATGQVADVHDVKEVNVRYLDDSDQDFDDESLDSYGQSGKPRTWGDFFFSIIALCTFASFGYTCRQAFIFKRLTTARIDIVNVCRDLNEHIHLSFILTFTIFFLSLVTFNWLNLLLNMPTAVLRVFLFFNGEMHFREAAVTGQGEKGHSAGGIPAKIRIGLNLCLGFVNFCYAFYRWFF